MEHDTREFLKDMFSHPGWHYLESTFEMVMLDQQNAVVVSARENPGDRYEVGRLDGSRGILDHIESIKHTCRLSNSTTV